MEVDMNGKDEYMTLGGKWRNKNKAWCDRCYGTGMAHGPDKERPGYSTTFPCPDCSPDYNFKGQ
jgi:hypothetical protein